MSTVVVPRTTNEFYEALGKAVREQNRNPALIVLFVLANRHSPHALEQSCGKLWCVLYNEQMQTLKVIAERALAETSPRTSLLSDIVNNMEDFRSFLQSCQPQYLNDVFVASINHDDDGPVQDFLRLLVQVAQETAATIDKTKKHQ